MPSATYVLDATPLFMGYAPALSATSHYTTQEIVDELGEQERLRITVARKWLRIREPSKKSLKTAYNAAIETGDNLVLSRSDLSILALSLDVAEEGAKVTLLTDDYAIQNVASKLQIYFQEYAWRGIQREIRWELYCPTCRKTYNTQRRICPNCGSALKRRALPGKRKEAHVKPRRTS